MMLRAMGDATTDTGSGAWGGLTQLFQSFGTALNTYQINQANIARAAQGLPPITSADVAPTVNVGLDPTLKLGLVVGGMILVAAVLARR